MKAIVQERFGPPDVLQLVSITQRPAPSFNSSMARDETL